MNTCSPSSMTFNMPGTIGGAKIIFTNQDKMEKIGIVGLGFVGGAIKEAMDLSNKV